LTTSFYVDCSATGLPLTRSIRFIPQTACGACDSSCRPAGADVYTANMGATQSFAPGRQLLRTCVHGLEQCCLGRLPRHSGRRERGKHCDTLASTTGLPKGWQDPASGTARQREPLARLLARDPRPRSGTPNLRAAERCCGEDGRLTLACRVRSQGRRGRNLITSYRHGLLHGHVTWMTYADGSS